MALTQIGAAVAAQARAVRDEFERFEPVPNRTNFSTLADQFQVSLEGYVIKANEEAKALELSDAEADR